MTRGRKFVTAGGILVLGVILAWPFRKSPHDVEYVPEGPNTNPTAPNGDRIAGFQPPATVPAAPSHVSAQMASSKYSNNEELTQAVGPNGSFDIANHPALAKQVEIPASQRIESPTIDAIPPAYETGKVVPTLANDHWPAGLVHVVANGDTLDKLATRYLNDSGRALEIFDLNRDQLSNPHLLPIGVELRVPLNPERIID